MKKFGIGTTLGILLALFISYVLGDLNSGAIALLTLLCIGVMQSLVWGISYMFGRGEKK